MAADALKAVKDGIVARQRDAYREAVCEASQRLREERAQSYEALLSSQKAVRGQLIDRQEKGLASPHLLRRAPFEAITPTPQVSHGREAFHPGTTQRPFVWTAKAGMAAQQRSATRWLDRALDRVRREAPVPPSSPARNRLHEFKERLASQKPKEKDKASVGIEPDGPGGSGL